MYQDFRILLSQCYAQMKISFPGLIFAQYKSINIVILLFLQSKERLAHIFNKPPLVAYRRPISLRDRLVSTKFKTVNNMPVPGGCEACGKPKWSWCKGINKTTTFTSSNNNKTIKIFHSVNCHAGASESTKRAVIMGYVHYWVQHLQSTVHRQLCLKLATKFLRHFAQKG